jgi:hypothetical protein
LTVDLNPPLFPPALPPELEYRTVGRDLVLRDVGAHLIVDAVQGVIPE